MFITKFGKFKTEKFKEVVTVCVIAVSLVMKYSVIMIKRFSCNLKVSNSEYDCFDDFRFVYDKLIDNSK